MLKIYKIKLLLLFSIYSLWFLNNKIQAQQKLPDQELLNSIEIMETVLDKLITPDRGYIHYFGSHNTKGFYLMNYGVIFNVSHSLFNRAIISFDISKRLKIKENNFYFADEEDKEVNEDIDKEIEKLKKSIIKFLSSWTSPLTELKPDEKVTVIINFNGFFPRFSDAYEFSIHQLIATASIREILNYRKGTISRQDFIERISFDEVKSIDEDISILSNVIETSLQHADKKVTLGLSGDVKGIYFKGYGAIFFTDLTLGTNAITIYTDALRKAKGRSITLESFSDKSAQHEKSVEKIEQKLIQLISNYGNNLGALQPDEWVEIAINFKGMPVKDNYSKSILKVQKKIIDDYNKDKIKFNQFKKMVKIVYY